MLSSEDTKISFLAPLTLWPLSVPTQPTYFNNLYSIHQCCTSWEQWRGLLKPTSYSGSRLGNTLFHPVSIKKPGPRGTIWQVPLLLLLVCLGPSWRYILVWCTDRGQSTPQLTYSWPGSFGCEPGRVTLTAPGGWPGTDATYKAAEISVRWGGGWGGCHTVIPVVPGHIKQWLPLDMA